MDIVMTIVVVLDELEAVLGHVDKSQASTGQQPVEPFAQQTYQLVPAGQSLVSLSRKTILNVVDDQDHLRGKV